MEVTTNRLWITVTITVSSAGLILEPGWVEAGWVSSGALF